MIPSKSIVAKIFLDAGGRPSVFPSSLPVGAEKGQGLRVWRDRGSELDRYTYFWKLFYCPLGKIGKGVVVIGRRKPFTNIPP